MAVNSKKMITVTLSLERSLVRELDSIFFEQYGNIPRSTALKLTLNAFKKEWMAKLQESNSSENIAE